MSANLYLSSSLFKGVSSSAVVNQQQSGHVVKHGTSGTGSRGGQSSGEMRTEPKDGTQPVYDSELKPRDKVKVSSPTPGGLAATSLPKPLAPPKPPAPPKLQSVLKSIEGHENRRAVEAVLENFFGVSGQEMHKAFNALSVDHPISMYLRKGPEDTTPKAPKAPEQGGGQGLDASGSPNPSQSSLNLGSTTTAAAPKPAPIGRVQPKELSVTPQNVTQQPVTQQPVTQQPVTQQPVTQQPVTQQPAPSPEGATKPLAAPKPSHVAEFDHPEHGKLHAYSQNDHFHVKDGQNNTVAKIPHAEGVVKDDQSPSGSSLNLADHLPGATTATAGLHTGWDKHHEEEGGLHHVGKEAPTSDKHQSHIDSNLPEPGEGREVPHHDNYKNYLNNVHDVLDGGHRAVVPMDSPHAAAIGKHVDDSGGDYKFDLDEGGNNLIIHSAKESVRESSGIGESGTTNFGPGAEEHKSEAGTGGEDFELTSPTAPETKQGELNLDAPQARTPETDTPQQGTEGTPLFDSADAPDVGLSDRESLQAEQAGIDAGAPGESDQIDAPSVDRGSDEEIETRNLEQDVEGTPGDRESLLEEQAGGKPSSGEVEMLGAPPVDQTRSAPSGYTNRMLRKQRREDAEVGATSQSSVQDTPPGWDGKWADDEAAYQSKMAEQSGAEAAPDTPEEPPPGRDRNLEDSLKEHSKLLGDFRVGDDAPDAGAAPDTPKAEAAPTEEPAADTPKAEDLQHTDDSGPIDHDGGAFEGIHKNGIPRKGKITYGDDGSTFDGNFTEDGGWDTGIHTDTDGTRTYHADGEVVDSQTFYKRLGFRYDVETGQPLDYSEGEAPPGAEAAPEEAEAAPEEAEAAPEEAEAAPDSELLHTDTHPVTMPGGWDYKGQRNANGFLQGEGILTHPDGRVREGTFGESGYLVEGKKTNPDGSIIEGKFGEGGYLTGQGKKTFSDGHYQEGVFENGNLLHGTESDEDGTVFRDDKGNTKRTYNTPAENSGVVTYEWLNDGSHKQTLSDDSVITSRPEDTDDETTLVPATRVRDGKEVQGTVGDGRGFKPNRIRDRIADFFYSPKEQKEEPATDTPESGVAPTEEPGTAESLAKDNSAQDLMHQAREAGISDEKINEAWSDTYPNSNLNLDSDEVKHSKALRDSEQHPEFREKLSALISGGDTPEASAEQPAAGDAPGTPPSTPEGEPPSPPEESLVEDANQEPPGTLPEKINVVAESEDVPQGLKDVLRDLPEDDATFEKKIDYIKKVMDELAKHQDKGRGTNWYALGKALMNPNPISAVESFFSTLGTVADNLVQDFRDLNHRRKVKKDLEERLGMNVPDQIRDKTKKIAESDPFGHGDVETTLGNTKYWTKARHEEFHEDHEGLSEAFENDKASGDSSESALKHKYSHLSDVVMRKHRALANAENGAYRSKTVPTMEDLNNLDMVIFAGVDGTSYTDPNKFNNLVKATRNWSREAQTEFGSMLDQVRKASPEDREEMLSTAVAKADMLNKLDDMARDKYNKVSKPEDRAPKRDKYSGSWKSDTYNELQSVIKDANGIQGALDRFKATGEKWDSRLNLQAEKLVQQLRKDLELEDHLSADDGVDTAEAPADTSWADSLPDTKDADGYKFENVKPDQNVGRGYKDPDGIEHQILRYHAPSGEYTVRRINPAYNPKLGNIDGTNEKFIDEHISAKDIHRAVKGGMYTGTHVRWAHDPSESGRDRGFKASLESVQGPVEHPDVDSLSKQEKIDHKIKGYEHYHHRPNRFQDRTYKADFGSAGFPANPKHNEGKGYLDSNKVSHFIEKYHAPSGDKEDFYTVKYVDFDGTDKTKEVPVEELSRSFLSGGGYKGHAANWHPSHEKNKGAQTKAREEQAKLQAELQGKSEDTSKISESVETFDAEKHLDPASKRSFTSIEDDLPHSQNLSEIFTGYADSEDPDFKIPLAYDITDEDSMRNTWGHWLSNANLTKKHHQDFVNAQDSFTRVKEWALENYDKDINSGVPQDKAVKKLRGRMVFAKGGYRDFASILRNVKNAAATDTSEDGKVGPFNLPENSEFKELHNDASAVLDKDDKKDMGFSSNAQPSVSQSRNRITASDVAPTKQRKAARGQEDVPKAEEASEAPEAPPEQAPEEAEVPTGEASVPDAEVEAEEGVETPEGAAEEVEQFTQKGDFTPEELQAVHDSATSSHMKGKLAKQHGFDNWSDLKSHLAEISPAEEAAAPEVEAPEAETASEEVDFSSGRIDLPEGKDTPDFEAIGRVGGAYREHGHDIKEEALEKLKALGVKDPEEAYNTVTSEVDDKAAKEAEEAKLAEARSQSFKKPTPEEAPLSAKEQKKFQTSTVKTLKGDDAAKKDWNTVQRIRKQLGDEFAKVEVVAFRDDAHRDEAYEGDDPHGSSVFGDLRDWDEVKDQIKPGMSLEFRLSTDAEGISDQLRAQGVDEDKIDKQIDRLGDLGGDFSTHTVTVPGKEAEAAAPEVEAAPEEAPKFQDEKLRSDAGMGDWEQSVEGKHPTWTSPDGLVVLKRKGITHEVFRGGSDTPESSHRGPTKGIKAAAELHAKLSEEAKPIKLHHSHQSAIDNAEGNWTPSRGEGGRLNFTSEDGNYKISDSGGKGSNKWQVLAGEDNLELQSHSSFADAIKTAEGVGSATTEVQEEIGELSKADEQELASLLEDDTISGFDDLLKDLEEGC
jgi:hypothetical protein